MALSRGGHRCCGTGAYRYRYDLSILSFRLHVIDTISYRFAAFLPRIVHKYTSDFLSPHRFAYAGRHQHPCTSQTLNRSPCSYVTNPWAYCSGWLRFQGLIQSKSKQIKHKQDLQQKHSSKCEDVMWDKYLKNLHKVSIRISLSIGIVLQVSWYVSYRFVSNDTQPY